MLILGKHPGVRIFYYEIFPLNAQTHIYNVQPWGHNVVVCFRSEMVIAASSLFDSLLGSVFVFDANRKQYLW